MDPSLRFCHGGEQFEEGDQLLETLDHGLYERCLVHGHPDTPTQYTWSWLGHLDALSDLITPILDQMTLYQPEIAMVDMVFHAAMMSLRRAPGAVRPDLQNLIHAGRRYP